MPIGTPVPLFRCILFVVFVEVYDHTAILQRLHAVLIDGVVPDVELAEQPAGFQNGDVLDLVVVSRTKFRLSIPARPARLSISLWLTLKRQRGEVVSSKSGMAVIWLLSPLNSSSAGSSASTEMSAIWLSDTSSTRSAVQPERTERSAISLPEQYSSCSEAFPAMPLRRTMPQFFDVEPLEAQAVVEVGDRLDRVVGQVQLPAAP